MPLIRDDEMRVFLALPMADSAKAAFGRLIEKLKPNFDDARWVPAANLHLTLVFIGEIKRTLVPDLIECVTDANAAYMNTLASLSGDRADFALTFDSLGFFGSARYPRVLFVKPPQAESDLSAANSADAIASARASAAVAAISALAGALRNATAQYAKPGDASFKPHLTLARFRRLERGERPSARNEQTLRLIEKSNADDGANFADAGAVSAAARREAVQRNALKFEPITSAANRFVLYESVFGKSGVSYSEIAGFPLGK